MHIDEMHQVGYFEMTDVFSPQQTAFEFFSTFMRDGCFRVGTTALYGKQLTTKVIGLYDYDEADGFAQPIMLCVSDGKISIAAGAGAKMKGLNFFLSILETGFGAVKHSSGETLICPMDKWTPKVEAGVPLGPSPVVLYPIIDKEEELAL